MTRNWWQRWLGACGGSWLRGGRVARPRRRSWGRDVESLEQRIVPAIITVTSLADNTTVDGQVTLREAVAAANSDISVDGSTAGSGADTIVFAASLFASGDRTLTLTQFDTGLDAGEFGPTAFIVGTSLTIQGPAGDHGLTIQRDASAAAFRLFHVQSAGSLTLDRLTLSGGIARGADGADEGSGDSESSGGSKNGTDGLGGGLFNQGSLTILNSTLSDHQAIGGDGGDAFDEHDPDGNGGIGEGGAIFNDLGIVSITNSTFTANVASGGGGSQPGGGFGGAVFSRNGTTTILSSTLSGNSASSNANPRQAGGAVFVLADGSASGSANVTINNSILANSNFGVSDFEASAINSGSGSLAGDGNLIENNAAIGGFPIGGIVTSADPQLQALADNGGPTRTMALLVASPAINAGLDSAASGLTTDQRGEARISLGPVDIGAFELTVSPSLVVDLAADEDDGNYGVGDLSLREAISLANVAAVNVRITFAPALFASGPATITLTQGQLVLSSTSAATTIEGPGAKQLAISGNSASRVFQVAANVTATLSGLTITNGNSLNGNGGVVADTLGGGILSFGDLTITESDISGNSAGRGGGIRVTDGELKLLNSTVSANTAVGSGGGVDVQSATEAVFIANSTIFGNEAERGGGLFSFGQAVKIVNSTFSNNIGGGLDVNQNTTVQNTIVANSVGPDIVLNGGPISGDHNLIEDGSGGLADTVSGDPLLGPLADNGGATRTHALLAGSPALNAGKTTTAINAGLTLDQRGARRIVGPVDIGAFELQPGAADQFVVDLLADEDDGNVTAGDLSLREAIRLANANINGSTITFAPSLFASGAATITLGSELPKLDTDVTITGPGASLLSISGNNATRILQVDWSGVVELDQLTLTEGNSNGGGPGGAIFSVGTLFISNCVLSHNQSGNGSAIAVRGGSLSILQSSVSHNQSTGINGGTINVTVNSTLSVFDSLSAVKTIPVEITNSTLAHNKESAGFGGAIGTIGRSESVQPDGTITQTRIEPDITIINSTLANNEAFNGGGISILASKLSVVGSSFLDNTGTDGAGGLVVGTNSTAEVLNSTFSGNRTITISGDFPIVAGAILNDGQLTVINSTLANNSAQSGGGLVTQNVATTTLINSIVANNTGGDLGGIGTLNGNHNLIGDGANLDNLTTTLTGDPGLAPLADNGGPTQTFALLADSPAIDAGNNASATNAHLTTDQRGSGFVRISRHLVDLGAFEFQFIPETPSLIVTTTTDIVDEFDGLTSLREAITFAESDPDTDTITFTSALNSQPILVSNGPFHVTQPLTITGNGALNTIIDGQNANQLFVFETTEVASATSSTRWTLTGLTLQNGVVSDVGGAIDLLRGSLQLSDSVLHNNSATTGGAIVAHRARTKIERSTFSSNSAGYQGGAIDNSAGPMTILDSLFTDNLAFRGEIGDINNGGFFGDGVGGAIANRGTMTIIGSTFTLNTAEDDGGAIHNKSNESMPMTIINSTFAFNTANGVGGAIFNDGRNLTVINSTIAHNNADADDIDELEDNTDGRAHQHGGGLFTYTAAVSVLKNTIVSQNFSGSGITFPSDIAGVNLAGGSTFNLISDAVSAGGLTDGTNGNQVGVDPQLSFLGNNGGRTQTFELLPDSPAINAGSNSNRPADTLDLDGDGNRTEVVPFDQRGAGFGRTVGSAVDIGAFEAPPATISVVLAPTEVSEDGVTNLVYTFSRTGNLSEALTVPFGVSGSATLGSDYAASGAVSFSGSTGSVRFLAGAATQNVTINPTTDTTIEANETVTLTITPGTGHRIGDSNAATGTILNDDFPAITVVVSPTSVIENGTANALFTFSRTGPTTQPLTVQFTVGGTATFGTDYGINDAASFNTTTGSVTFAAGQASARITLDPTGDSDIEPNETATVTLVAGAGYVLGTAARQTATATILADDAEVSLAIATASVTEDGSANLDYTFTRVGAISSALTVHYTVGGSATFRGDYGVSSASVFTATTGSVVIPANQASKTIRINPTSDTLVEPNETVVLTIATAATYQVGTSNSATGTILNDDPRVTVTVDRSRLTENGTTNAIYTFRRTGPTTAPLTANFSIGGTATFNTDYTLTGAASLAETTGTVTFAAGQSTARITLDPTGDNTLESDETAILTVTNGETFVVGTPNIATATITNDDSEVTVTVSPASVVENGSPNLIFTFTRTGFLGASLTVTFTIGGTATSGTDYATVSSSITFGSNVATKTLTINPNSDTVVEEDETVIVSLLAGVNHTLGTSSVATGIITNDDGF